MLKALVFIGLILGMIGYAVYKLNPGGVPEAIITNFEECAKVGNPVMESYPEQCRANGQTFVKEH